MGDPTPTGGEDMFDHRSVAALQREKQHRFSKEAERDQARQASTSRLGFADRLLNAIGRRLVSIGETLISDKRAAKAATAAHGPVAS